MKSLGWFIEHTAILTQDSPPLVCREFELPSPPPGWLKLKIRACGICHTDLDEIEGRVPINELPRIPGHQVIATVCETGEGTSPAFSVGTRVGAGWFFKSCGQCQFCLSNRQNLCSHFEGTGRDAHGGFATHMLIPQQAAIPIPSTLEDHIAAPCLCAGAVGYRAWRIAVKNVGTIDSIGFMGYGASAHLLTAFLRQKFPHIHIHVFARREESRRLALDTGAATVTPAHEAPPSPLQAIIDTTPAWEPVIHALDFLQPGGILVINAIAKESADQNALMHIDYRRHLWMEKKLTTVANVTPRDLNEFLTLCGSIKLPIHVQTYAFDQLPQAIIDLRHSRGVGAKVLLTPP